MCKERPSTHLEESVQYQSSSYLGSDGQRLIFQYSINSSYSQI